jgi:hypothetical protein
MKIKSSSLKTVGKENQKPPKDKTNRSEKNKLQDELPYGTDLQSLNNKAKEYPFSNYYKAKNNDPL